jgi:hypothetical protein
LALLSLRRRFEINIDRRVVELSLILGDGLKDQAAAVWA